MAEYVWRCTHSEDGAELTSLAAGVGGTVLPETVDLYPSIKVESEEQPANMTFTNSGEIVAELTGGIHAPQKPK